MFLKVRSLAKDITYRMLIVAVCLILLSLEFIPICCATSGTVIVFERENVLDGTTIDLGHVGVAIQLENGRWLAGAIEGYKGYPFILKGQENGGWVKEFPTIDDVLKEFAATYEMYKVINVENPNYGTAEEEIKKFDDKRGFSIPDNDCLTNVYAVLKAYGATVPDLPQPPTPEQIAQETVLGSPLGSYLWYLMQPNNLPKNYFNNLPGASKSLSPYKTSLSSFLKIGTPLLPSPTLDTSPRDSTKGPYVPPTTTVTKVSYSPNMPGNWIMYIGSTPTRLTFTQEDVRNEVLNEFPDADLSQIDSMGKIYDDKGQTNLYSWWTLSETEPGVYEVYGMIGSPFSGTVSETGLIGWIGARMEPMHAEKIGDSPIKKTVTTYNVPSNVAGVGPLGGGGGVW